MNTQVPESTQVVVVGGGVIGLSAALHLAELGVTDVAVLDRHLLADGTTPQAAGQTLSLADPESPIAPFRRYCNDFFDSYPERLGYPLNHAQPGAVHVAAAQRFRQAVVNDWKHGGEPMSAEAVRRMVPNLSLPDETNALYVERDGWVDAREYATGMAARAGDLGVGLHTNVDVTEITPGSTGVVVGTADGRSISADKVVICGGAWTREVVARLGTRIPVVSVRHQFVTTIPFPALSRDMPLVRLIDDQIYMRPHQGGLAYGGYGIPTAAIEPGEISADFEMYELEESAKSVPLLTAMAAKWFKGLADMPLTKVSRGLITMTPDHLPLIGPLADHDDILVATGCQVSGIAQSPGGGGLVASLVTNPAFADGDDELAPYARLADPRRFEETPFTEELRQDGVDSYNRLFWWNLGSDLIADTAV
jgi:glycine/D-amino acid oxidase-like deaminating enzyme